MKREQRHHIRQQVRETSMATHTESHTGYGESLCGDNHGLLACSTFRLLPVEHRRRVVKAQGRCFICLKNSHLAKNCKARSCDINDCNGKHSRWLHSPAPVDQSRRNHEQHEESTNLILKGEEHRE
ncbi:uncharacterized protein LOC123511084 [Portunus trituberculatus]|uniref:uncharacterized protein LOC123511084 n=1 Tax=Portunus trituberculatus TaxID=210409 RepID=UPI001E1CD0C1|nr:uncharacterized protein LOC123511084 [Portunus trituberculatus]